MATIKLTIQSGEVAGTHSDMPLVIIPSAITDFGAITLAEAQSIRCYSDSGLTTELAREVKSADEIHVKNTSVSSTTEVYVDYDGSRSDYATTATYGAENVWTDYDVVLHGDDYTNSVDTSSVTNSGTEIEAGQIGDAFKFVHNNADYIDLGSETWTNEFSVTAWFKQAASTDTHYIVGRRESSANRHYQMGVGAAGTLFTNLYNGGSGDAGGNTTGSTAVDTDTLIYVANTINGNTSNGNKLYMNASLESQATPSTFPASETQPTYLGGRAQRGFGDFGDGLIDEYRKTSDGVILSGDWITTEYNNQKDNGAFWAAEDVGGVQNSNFLMYY